MKHRIIVVLTVVLAVALGTSVAVAGNSQPTTFATAAGHYEAIRQAMLNGRIAGIAGHAKAIQDAAQSASKSFDAASVGVSKEKAADGRAVLPKIAAAAGQLAAVKDLTQARKAFFELSKPMIQFRDMASGDRPVVVYCSMEKKSWLQPGGRIGNPYVGQAMALCGVVTSK